MHISSSCYGKCDVRLTRVSRGERDEVFELSADVLLDGDFNVSYAEGDNHRVVPTDTMKNTVYALAKRRGVEPLESFGRALGEHFVQRYDAVARATVRLSERPWQRLAVGGDEHPAAFIGTSGERATCEIVATKDGVAMASGIEGLAVMKTSGSSFAGFLKDELTTLAETHDRLLATTISAHWRYVVEEADWTACRRIVRDALLECFAGHESRSVQHTLYAMAEAALGACRPIGSIKLQMPNQHRLPVDLTPLGLENDNEFFTATDAPYGHIEAEIQRGPD